MAIAKLVRLNVEKLMSGIRKKKKRKKKQVKGWISIDKVIKKGKK